MRVSARLRVVPHFSSGIVERAWKSLHARKARRGGEREKWGTTDKAQPFDPSRPTDFGVWSSEHIMSSYFSLPAACRLSSRGVIFTRARVRSLYYPWGQMGDYSYSSFCGHLGTRHSVMDPGGGAGGSGGPMHPSPYQTGNVYRIYMTECIDPLRAKLFTVITKKSFLNTLGKQVGSNYQKVWKTGSKITVLAGKGKFGLVWVIMAGISKKPRVREIGILLFIAFTHSIFKPSWNIHLTLVIKKMKLKKKLPLINL